MPRLIEIHPGKILRTEYLEPFGISAHRLAQELQVTAPRVNDIVLERRGINAEVAIRLARYFSTTPQLWSNLQSEYERRVAANALSAAELKRIRPRVEDSATCPLPHAAQPKRGRPRKQRISA